MTTNSYTIQCQFLLLTSGPQSSESEDDNCSFHCWSWLEVLFPSDALSWIQWPFYTVLAKPQVCCYACQIIFLLNEVPYHYLQLYLETLTCHEPDSLLSCPQLCDYNFKALPVPEERVDNNSNSFISRKNLKCMQVNNHYIADLLKKKTWPDKYFYWNHPEFVFGNYIQSAHQFIH